MAAENIGVLVPTKIPGYVDAADIQAALRLYHYGSYTFDPNESDPAELINPSIAYTINDLQDQIDAIGSGGILPTIFTAKGGLISSTAANTPAELVVGGSNGMVLTVNSATATGLEWAVPVVTLSNTVTLTNKTLTSPAIDGVGIVFEGSTADSFETTLAVVDPTADNTITLPNQSGNVILADEIQLLNIMDYM